MSRSCERARTAAVVASAVLQLAAGTAAAPQLRAAPVGEGLPGPSAWVPPLSFALALLATTLLLFAAARGRRRRAARAAAQPSQRHQP